jgi:hypothetical protein
MFIEDLIKSEERQKLLLAALSNLYQCGYFPAALELAMTRAGIIDGPDVTERAAIQRGFIEGYKEALMDLYHFNERYVLGAKQSSTKADYGALSALVAQGVLTKEEADGIATANKPK